MKWPTETATWTGWRVEADSLTGGTIRDEARNNAELDHDGVAADAGHKVDGVKPRTGRKRRSGGERNDADADLLGAARRQFDA